MIRVRPSEAGEASRAYLRGGRAVKKIDLYSAAVQAKRDADARTLGYSDHEERMTVETRAFDLIMRDRISYAEYKKILRGKK